MGRIGQSSRDEERHGEQRASRREESRGGEGTPPRGRGPGLGCESATRTRCTATSCDTFTPPHQVDPSLPHKKKDGWRCEFRCVCAVPFIVPKLDPSLPGKVAHLGRPPRALRLQQPEPLLLLAGRRRLHRGRHLRDCRHSQSKKAPPLNWRCVFGFFFPRAPLLRDISSALRLRLEAAPSERPLPAVPTRARDALSRRVRRRDTSAGADALCTSKC